MKIKGKFAKTYDRFVGRPSLLPSGLLNLIQSISARSILELGTGTGTVAVGLSLAGFNVTGVDYSEDMLKVARKKAIGHKVKIEFCGGNVADSLFELNRKFDLILCLGNTIPHFTTQAMLKIFLNNCQKHLAAGGHVIFQQLNYDRILAERPVTFAIDVDRDIVRFKQNRYRKNHIDFVVTLVDSTNIPPRQSVSVVKLKPWIKAELNRKLTEQGFRKTSFYGDYGKGKFTRRSKDLIVVAGVL